jgi:preprotein translocase subunit YajC
MNLIKKSGVARALLVLALFSVFSSHANRGNCMRRAARIACHAYLTIGSTILCAGGVLAAVCKQPEPAHLVCLTSTTLLTVGASGVYNGLHGLAYECCENMEESEYTGLEKED